MSFLFTTWEGGGSVTPALTVASKLSDRGHQVRVMSDQCNRPEAEAAGATFVPWTRAPSRPDRSKDSDVFRDWEVNTPQEQFQRVLDRIMAGPSLLYAEDVIEELKREPADLVVSSEMLFGVMVGCEAIGQKFALLTCNVSLFPLDGVPPIGPGLTPARTAADEALHREVARANRRMFDSGLPAVNAARAAFGLPPLASLADQHRAAERLLLGTSQAFDFAPLCSRHTFAMSGRSWPTRPGRPPGSRPGLRTTRAPWCSSPSARASRITPASCRPSSMRQPAFR